MLQVVILAGGLATRLHPITKKIPKSLIEVAGFPFIHHQLKYLEMQGIKKVHICLGHMGGLVQEFILKQSYVMSISFSFDGRSQLGTGGALKNALDMLDDKFFVLYGDSFLPIIYSKVYSAFNHNQDFAVMTIMKNDNKFDVSNVEFIENNLIYYDKKHPRLTMKYIDYGLSVISRKILYDYSADNEFDLADLMHSLSQRRNLLGYEVFDRFYEIGSYDGLAETRAYFSKVFP